MYINYFQCAILLNLVDIHEFFYTPRKKKKQKNKEIYMGNFINNAPFALVIVFLIIGFVLLIKGADFFVEGSSSVAKRLHVPSIIIGLQLLQWEHRFQKRRSVYLHQLQATMSLQ